MITSLSHKRTPRIWHSLMVSAALVVCLAAAVLMWLESVRSTDLTQTEEFMKIDYAAAFNASKATSHALFHSAIEQPEILGLMHEAVRKNDRTTRVRVRQELITRLMPIYLRTIGEIGLQIHFVLPDGTSLLRFHSPDQWGDELHGVRPIIRLANERREDVAGFEGGRYSAGAFRYIFTLEHDGVHVGVVELSAFFPTIALEMKQLEPESAFSFLMKRDKAIPKLARKEERALFSRSDINPDYVIDLQQRNAWEKDHTFSLLSRYGDKASLSTLMNTGASFSISLGPYLSREHVAHFLSIKNIAGEQEAYLIAASRLPMMREQNRAAAIVFCGGSLLLVGLVFLWRRLALNRQQTVEERNTLISITEAMGEGLLVQHRDSSLRYMNSTVERLLGYSWHELANGSVHDLIHVHGDGSSYPVSHCPIKNAVESSLTYRNDTELFRTRDGLLLPVEVTATPLVERGEIIGSVTVFRDITERKRAEEENLSLQHQLLQSQKMESVGQMAGGIAHDFNNILTVIIGHGSILLGRLGEDDPSHQSIKKMLAAAERAADLTRSLLAFSRKQVISPKVVDLNQTLLDVGKMLERIIGEDIDLEITGYNEPLTVIADQTQLEQVLINLATNARDSMPNGGHLMISTYRIEFDDDYVKRHGYGEPGSYAGLKVADTGIGMNESVREKIFEPFFTTKELGKGTGLGLSIVYGIVKQHNGYINIYSEVGKGTIFRIYLPLAKSEIQETIPEKDSVTPRGGSETILLAEDDPEVRLLTKNLLEDFGYRVIEAADGEEALRKFELNRDGVQLLILDVIMPKKNGREVYAEARTIRPNVKTLFTSGYTSDLIQKKGILEPGFNFISKPSSFQAFLGKVREVLDSRDRGDTL